MLFAVEVDEEWLDVLDALANNVLNSTGSTTEEAMEANIFSQLKLQLVKQAEETDFSWISSRQEAREEIQRRKNLLSLSRVLSRQKAEALRSEIRALSEKKRLLPKERYKKGGF